MTGRSGRAIGVDVGGTKIAVGLVDLESGSVEGFRTLPTPVAEGGAAVLGACVDLTTRLVADLQLPPGIPIGIGLCELVDLDGRPAGAVTVDWRGLDLSGAFAALGPVTLESDIRAAAAAEATLGGGRGHGHVLYLTVSTGISYALVVGGRVYAGAHGNAILVGAPEIESVAAGPAIAAATGMSTRDAVDDSRSADVVRAAASEVGAALAFLINALDPAVVVIGGGLGLNPVFREAVEQEMRSRVSTDISRAIPVVPAALGDRAGVVGAALIAPTCHSPD